MVDSVTTPTDGRRARRERNRSAVIDATFSLLAEGHTEISAELLAARSGVSVSSIFRYFDGLDDLVEQSIRTHFERNAALFDLPDPDPDSRTARVDALVATRVHLHETLEPVARIARSRSLHVAPIARALQSTRQRFLAQVREHLAADLAGLDRTDADDRVAAIDVLTSFESWDLLHHAHGRSARLVARVWSKAVAAILD